MRYILLALFFLTPLLIHCQIENLIIGESPLNRLSRRILDLKNRSTEQRAEIDIKQKKIDDLLRQREQSDADIERLEKDIEGYTREILSLNRSLIDTKFQYDQLMYELNLSEDKNDALSETIIELEENQKLLDKQLASSNRDITILSEKLKTSRLSAEKEAAENAQLMELVNAFSNKDQSYWLFQISGLSDFGLDFSISNSFALSPNKLAGIQIGYSRLRDNRSDSEIEKEIDTISVDYLNISFDARIALGKNSMFRSKYMVTGNKFVNYIIPYSSFQVGMSLPLNRGLAFPSTLKYRLSPKFNLGIGLLIPSNSGSRIYVELGGLLQIFRAKNIRTEESFSDFEGLFQYTAGFHF
ncbi:MAG: hypothetical protein ACRBG0_27380 [Lewinella sp.]|uniref:hypothetical protein n=1 Tax=Lewinella sp. TaxID=2004506 RepID=UPI003D6A598F